MAFPQTSGYCDWPNWDPHIGYKVGGLLRYNLCELKYGRIRGGFLMRGAMNRGPVTMYRIVTEGEVTSANSSVAVVAVPWSISDLETTQGTMWVGTRPSPLFYPHKSF